MNAGQSPSSVQLSPGPALTGPAPAHPWSPNVQSPEGSPTEGCRVWVEHRLGHRLDVSVCNRDVFSVWASVSTLALGSTPVGTRPTAEGNTVVQKIPRDLKEASSHFPLPSRYPPHTHLNHKAAEEKALVPPHHLSLQLATLRHPNMAPPEFQVSLGICAQHCLLLRSTTTVYP